MKTVISCAGFGVAASGAVVDLSVFPHPVEAGGTLLEGHCSTSPGRSWI